MSNNPKETKFDLKKAHHHVRAVSEMLDWNVTDVTGLLNGMRRHIVLRVKVSKPQVNRALLFMESLVRALEARSAKFIKVQDSDTRELRVEDERIECVLIEETTRTTKSLDDKSWGRQSWSWKAAGRLRFEIEHYYGSRKKNGQGMWSEPNQQRLDDQLGNIVEGLFKRAQDTFDANPQLHFLAPARPLQTLAVLDAKSTGDL